MVNIFCVYSEIPHIKTLEFVSPTVVKESLRWEKAVQPTGKCKAAVMCLLFASAILLKGAVPRDF